MTDHFRRAWRVRNPHTRKPNKRVLLGLLDIVNLRMQLFRHAKMDRGFSWGKWFRDSRKEAR